MKKIVIFITSLIILLVFVFAISLLNTKKIEEKENVAFFFDLIEKDTGINLLNIQNSTIDWRVVDENDNVVVVEKLGKIVEIKNISQTESEKINNFFEENGFELDVYNLADGPQGSIKGYRKNKMYCIIKKDYKFSGSDATEIIDVTINCAI